MLIKNACMLDGSVKDILIKDKKFAKIEPNLEDANEQIIDAKNRLIMPPFVESHIHLDSALSAGEPRFNESGTLFEGISIWQERKQKLSIKDVKTRALKCIKMQVANGVGYIRTHCDVNDEKLIALQALLELKEELKDVVTLQIVAFPQYGVLSEFKAKDLLAQALKMGADCVGAIPHFEFCSKYAEKSLEIIIDLAVKYDKLVDVHCDEIDDENSKNLEYLATLAYESGLKSKVSASHTTAMHSYNNAYCYKLFRLLRMSEINFVCNPLVNLHLQGRFDTYPKRRGLTRVKELLENGCNVSFGHDDIKDPWNPLGNANMLQVLFNGLYATQMLGESEIKNSYKLISYNGAKTLNIDYGIEVGKSADCILLERDNFKDNLNENANILMHVKAGRILSECKPKELNLMI